MKENFKPFKGNGTVMKAVNAGEIALPTDGYRTTNDPRRWLLDQREDSRSGEKRPMPHSAAPQTVAPAIGSADLAPATVQQAQRPAPATSAAAKPGFSF